MRIWHGGPTPRVYLHGGRHARHDEARGMAARHATMRYVVGHVAPSAWRRPSKRRHAPHHATNASMANRHALSLLPRGGPRLGKMSVALPTTTISSKPHFSLLTNLFALPLPYSLVIPSLRPCMRFQLGRVRSSGFDLDFAPERNSFSLFGGSYHLCSWGVLDLPA